MRPILLTLLLAACAGGTEDAPKTDAEVPVEAAKIGKPQLKRPEPKVIPAPDDVAAAPADAQKTASGLAFKVLTPGTGTESPVKLGRVTGTFTGWTPDGKMFETNEGRPRPGNIGMDEVMLGLAEALQTMVAGEKRRLWVPEALARGGVVKAPGGPVVYDVELKVVTNPPAAPADVAAPPADATRTATGLAYKVLQPGTGTEQPTPKAKITVHYTGWSTAGVAFDTTVTKGRPGQYTLSDSAMPGWREAIATMVVGQKSRFWIPQALANDGVEGREPGMLVYEVELLAVENPVPAPDDVAAPPRDAKKTASGLAYKVLQPGKGGDKPSPEATVTVNYTGWTTDGAMFDTSTKRPKPATFPLNRVIPGWTEGLQLMAVGEKTRFWIPVELAYNNQPGKPAGMLVFDVELVEYKNPPPPIPAPSDVAAPPADAKKTASGLAYRVIKPGTGTEHPTAEQQVQVNYTGWTTDGKMFDSSLTRGQPATFPLNRVIAGWTEGLQLMVVGETTRFWIPVDLAYKNQPGKPAGMLVFDVELQEIKAAGAAGPRH